jgi:hypothetical protein
VIPCFSNYAIFRVDTLVVFYPLPRVRLTLLHSCFGLLLLLFMVCWKCLDLAFSTILLVLFRAIL